MANVALANNENLCIKCGGWRNGGGASWQRNSWQKYQAEALAARRRLK